MKPFWQYRKFALDWFVGIGNAAGIGASDNPDNQVLFQDITAMERAANLYAVLNDPRVAKAFESNYTAFNRTLEKLADYVPETDINQVRAAGEASASFVRNGAAGMPPSSVVSRFEVLGVEANRLAQRARLGIDARLKDVESQAAATQQGLLWALMGLVPAAFAIAGIFWFYVLRPLRAIDRAISDLGRGTFSQVIAISGPADLSALGRQLEWLRTRLLDIALERNRFLRHMSHELKTPLRRISARARTCCSTAPSGRSTRTSARSPRSCARTLCGCSSSSRTSCRTAPGSRARAASNSRRSG